MHLHRHWKLNDTSQPTICATGVQYWVLGVNAEHDWDAKVPCGTGQDREQYVQEVAVSDKLQEDTLLGANIPLWVHLVKALKLEEMTKVKELVLKEECSYAVMTRARARKMQERLREVAEEVSNTDSPLTDHLEEEDSSTMQQDPQDCLTEAVPDPTTEASNTDSSLTCHLEEQVKERSGSPLCNTELIGYEN